MGVRSLREQCRRRAQHGELFNADAKCFAGGTEERCFGCQIIRSHNKFMLQACGGLGKVRDLAFHATARAMTLPRLTETALPGGGAGFRSTVEIACKQRQRLGITTVSCKFYSWS
ncbi:unnamed protein product [Symbiodinium natans]|uniref:Uncharacterized protein n=1 Tax=Symbiodinium natans TaxID=878477 RepID=A0A812QEE2_9DINO|nr:unnamed protein product [Symbiodinium natans]